MRGDVGGQAVKNIQIRKITWRESAIFETGRANATAAVFNGVEPTWKEYFLWLANREVQP